MEDDEEEVVATKTKRGTKGKRKRQDDMENDDDPKPKKRGRPAREKPAAPKNKRLIRQLKRLMDIVIKYEDRLERWSLCCVFLFFWVPDMKKVLSSFLGGLNLKTS